MLIPFQWIGLFATLAVFAVMFAIGLMLGREQVAAALDRRVVLAAVVFAVVVPVPLVAVLPLKAFALKGPMRWVPRCAPFALRSRPDSKRRRRASGMFCCCCSRLWCSPTCRRSSPRWSAMRSAWA